MTRIKLANVRDELQLRELNDSELKQVGGVNLMDGKWGAFYDINTSVGRVNLALEEARKLTASRGQYELSNKLGSILKLRTGEMAGRYHQVTQMVLQA